jgi:hypothetical protein
MGVIKISMDMSEIRQRYDEAARNVSDVYRYRILTYGPQAARLLLRSFDDLGELLREHGEQD